MDANVSSLKFKVIKHGGKKYNDTIALRDEVLRKPLGLQFTPGQLEAEKDQVHIAGSLEKKLVCCLVLIIDPDRKAQMRQVVVAPSHQQKGLGKEIVRFTEAYLMEREIKVMYCNSRDLAVPFYKKLGYKIVGDQFFEVTIPHFRMEK